MLNFNILHTQCDFLVNITDSRTSIIQIHWSHFIFQRRKSLRCQTGIYIVPIHYWGGLCPLHTSLWKHGRWANFQKHALIRNTLTRILVRTAEAAVQTSRILLFRSLLDNYCPAFPLKLVVWNKRHFNYVTSFKLRKKKKRTMDLYWWVNRSE